MYGSEVYGCLSTVYRQGDVADDAFSLMAEKLWKAFPTFAWRCSVRTWVYLLAHNAAFDALRQRARHDKLRDSSSAFDNLVAEIRTETRSFLRTENRSALNQLRDELSPEDAMLLVLRVDRKMAWRDIASVLSPAESDEALDRESARLRQHFRVLRARLRERGKALGLF